MIIFIVLVVKNRHDKHHIIDLEKKHQKEMDNVEATYAKAARQGFHPFLFHFRTVPFFVSVLRLFSIIL